MQGTEIEDRLIEIARMRASDQPGALHELLQQLKPVWTKGEIKEQFAAIKANLAEMNMAERVDPVIQRLLDDGWFMFLSGSKVRVAKFENTPINGHWRRSINMLSPQDFTIWVQHLDPRAKPEESPGKFFLKHPDVPRYEGRCVRPDRPDELNIDGKLNLWAGFGSEPQADRGRWKVFHTHVLRLCGGDEKLARYILDWIAWGFQNPSKPIGTVPVFVGKQGTGKGVLGNLLEAVWGTHGVSIRKKKALVGDFNSHLMWACFAFVDEAFFAGNREGADIIKGMVTEPTLMIEAKFEDQIPMTNMLKLMMATNHDHAIIAELQERRYVVVRVPDDMPGSGDPYWDEFVRACNCPAGYGAILHEMLNRDLSDFHPERDRPETAIYTEQKRASLRADLMYWRHVIDEGTLTPGERMRDQTEGSPEWPTEDKPSGQLLKKKLYGFYVDFHYRRRLRDDPVTSETFWRNVSTMKFTIGSPKQNDTGDPDWEKGDRSVVLASFREMEERLTERLRSRRVGSHPEEAPNPP